MPSPDSEDALPADCCVERLKAIAKSMDLTSYSRLRKEELQAFISTPCCRSPSVRRVVELSASPLLTTSPQCPSKLTAL